MMRTFKSRDYTIKAQSFPDDIWEIRVGKYFVFKLPDHIFRALYEPTIEKPKMLRGLGNAIGEKCIAFVKALRAGLRKWRLK